MNEWIKEKREIWVNIISNHLLVNQLGFLKDISRDSQDGPIFRNTSDLLVQVLISDQYSGHSAPLQPVGAGTDCCSTSLHPSPENTSASQSVSPSLFQPSSFIFHPSPWQLISVAMATAASSTALCTWVQVRARPLSDLVGQSSWASLSVLNTNTGIDSVILCTHWISLLQSPPSRYFHGTGHLISCHPSTVSTNIIVQSLIYIYSINFSYFTFTDISSIRTKEIVCHYGGNSVNNAIMVLRLWIGYLILRMTLFFILYLHCCNALQSHLVTCGECWEVSSAALVWHPLVSLIMSPNHPRDWS